MVNQSERRVSAQTEQQQPIGYACQSDLDCEDEIALIHRSPFRDWQVPLYAAPIAQTELVEALRLCMASLDQLLPYLAKVPADIGLLNGALIAGRLALSSQGGNQ